ncbi:MAG: hypothetical protein LBR58_00380 [Propionibacteriaceae bacterium]|nr:hypothetical protein [Propionibacteriaceae bacterium]
MSDWNKQTRFEALLSGELADRPIAAAWGHFIPAETDPAELAAAHTAFANDYDWDWVKINPRNSYYAEAFGNTYDYNNYRGAQPAQVYGVINTIEDVWKIDRDQADGAQSLVDQVTLTRLLRGTLPDTPIVQTVFSPLTVLLTLAGQPRHVGGNIHGSHSSATLSRLVSAQPAGLHNALDEIAHALADYISQLAAVGADGIYYALTSTAHDEIAPQPVFEEFSAPRDRKLIDVARSLGLKVILHTCGPRSYPERFYGYGAHAVSWDHFAPANRSLDPADPIVPVGGVAREDIARQDAGAVRDQALQVLAQFAGRPLLLSPTCGVSTAAGNAALHTLRESVEEARSGLEPALV